MSDYKIIQNKKKKSVVATVEQMLDRDAAFWIDKQKQ